MAALKSPKTTPDATTSQTATATTTTTTTTTGSKTNDSTISQSEITSILSSCTHNFRFDGRSNLQTRPYTLIKTNTQNQQGSETTTTTVTATPILSNGSSRIFLPGSNTNILCSIKAEIVHPPIQHPNEGLIDLNIDLLPFAASSSTTSMDRRNVRKEEMELTSTLQHLLLPHLVEKKEELVIVKGRFVWRLNIDVLVLHCDGNLMDVCSMAIWGAMQNVKLPNVVPVVLPDESKHEYANANASSKKTGKKVSDEIMLDGDIANSIVPKGVSKCPIVITVSLLPKYDYDDVSKSSANGGVNGNGNGNGARYVSKHIDSVMVIDPTRQEEACASTKVSVSVDPEGNVCGVHKYGSSSVLLPVSGNSNGSSGDGNDGNNDVGTCTSRGTIALKTLLKVQNAAISVSRNIFDMMLEDNTSNTSGDDTSLGMFNNFFKGHFELQ